MTDGSDVMPEARMFTFRTSSEKPTYRVRCNVCGWVTRGNDPSTFARADRHVCHPASDLTARPEDR